MEQHYTLHSIEIDETGTPVSKIFDENPLRRLEFAKRCADFAQIDARSLGYNLAFQVRDQDGNLVYWTSLTHPDWEPVKKS